MAEKSLREVLEESKRIAHETAALAREAMQPRFRTVRDAVGKMRHHTGRSPAPHVDPSPCCCIVPGERGLYEVHQAHDEEGRAAEYTVHRRTGHHDTEFIGSFEVTEKTMSLRCVHGVSTKIEMAGVAAAWLEQSRSP